MRNKLKSYINKYSDNKFFKLIHKKASILGTKIIYSGLLLYFAYQRSETPSWAKNIILGSLGYLLTPIDVIPDLTPVLGYTDDIGVLSFGLVTIASFINNEIKTKAKNRMSHWFGTWDETEVLKIDAKL